MNFQSNIISKDELFFRFSIIPENKIKNSSFYVHDSLNHVRKGQVKKRVLTSRDLGQYFHAVVSGANYEYLTSKNEELMFSFFTGMRSNGVGHIKDGEIEFGLGRHNEFDD